MEKVVGVFSDTATLRELVCFLDELNGRGRIKYYYGKGIVEVRVQTDCLDGVVEWI